MDKRKRRRFTKSTVESESEETYGQVIPESEESLRKMIDANAELAKKITNGLPALPNIMEEFDAKSRLFTDGIINQTFEYDIFNFWYANGRSPLQTAENLITAYAEGKSSLLEYFVNRNTFAEYWRRGEVGVQTMRRSVKQKIINLTTVREWDKRANELDAEIKARNDRNIVEQRVKMLNEHVELGKLMQRKGKEYLEENGIDSGRDAIRAIEKGVEIERLSVGMPTNVLQVMSLPDEELIRRYKAIRGDVVDGEFAEVKSLPEPQEDIQENDGAEDNN